MTRSALVLRDCSKAAKMRVKWIASECFPDDCSDTDGFDTSSLPVAARVGAAGSTSENLEGVVPAACDALHQREGIFEG